MLSTASDPPIYVGAASANQSLEAMGTLVCDSGMQAIFCASRFLQMKEEKKERKKCHMRPPPPPLS